jgi:uncharacterized protein (TIRG00374 family)
MFKKITTWIGIILLILAFYYLFHNTDKNQLWTAVTQFHFIWLLPALLIYMLGYVIRGFRWVVLLSPIKKCSFQSLFPTLMIGFMANNIFPARAGELIRAHLNGKKEGISSSASFATIILERLFDGLTMILVLWASLLFGNLPIKQDRLPAIVFLILFLLVFFKKTAVKLIGTCLSMAPKKWRESLGKIVHTFIDGLQTLQNAKESFLILVMSLSAWTCEFTSYYFLAVGMGIAPSPLTLWSAALIMTIVNLAILLPSTPGGIGIFESIGVLIVTPFGIDKPTAIAYMILVHLMVFIPITLLGAYFYTKEHLNINKITPPTKKTVTTKHKKKKARK